MRIIGEFDIDQIKVTVFIMNEKVSVKYEYQLMEQTYKFRDGSGIKTLEDVRRFSEGPTAELIKQVFENMSFLRSQSILEMQPKDEDGFDEII